MRARNPIVARTLIIGVSVSFLLLAAGIVEALLVPTALLSEAPALRDVPSGVVEGDAVATLTAGLLVLILTPLARVIVLLFEFARDRESSFVVISIVVLLFLVASVVISAG